MLAAGLLFLVQPMVARMVLPAFGGSPQVWTTAMLFFQTSLLAGYGYTHWTTNRLQRKTQLGLHLVLVFLPLLLLLPIVLTVSPSGRGGAWPTLELLQALIVGVAVPFIMIATSGPLIQRWFSYIDHPYANDPYFLYAAGNVGSIGGLLAYPFLFEPVLSVSEQSRYWMYGYGLVSILLLCCGLVVWTRSGSKAQSPSDADRLAGATPPPSPAVTPATGNLDNASLEPIGWKRMGYWLLLSFVPSSLMLGVTAHITTDVASIPMLWALPLATYLLSFTIAFSKIGKGALQTATWLAPAVVVLAICLRPGTLGVGVAIGVQVALVLVGGLIGHGKLSVDRPSPQRLTLFYLILSVGGACGGLFNGLVAPYLFPHVFEYGLIAAATVGLVIHWPETVYRSERWPSALRICVALILFVIPLALMGLIFFDNLPQNKLQKGLLIGLMLAPLLTVYARGSMLGLAVLLAGVFPQSYQFANAVSIERTFFGVHRVTKHGQVLQLVHGTTIHGRQDLSSMEARQVPLSYYHREQPCGDLMGLLESRQSPLVGGVGLGAGTIAAYADANMKMVFFEIDPAVVRIADEQFRFLYDARQRGADVPPPVLGDGRLTIQSSQDKFDLLILDAFSSDSIPVHLLTLEAIEIYLEAIAEDGLIAFHISNNYLNLEPVLRGALDSLNQKDDKVFALRRFGRKVEALANPSDWVVFSRRRELIEPLRESGWQELTERSVIWTDQRSSLWSVRIE